MLSLVLMLACGPDTAVVEERDALKAEVAELSQSKERVERERDALKSRVEKLNDEMEAMRKREIYGKLGIEEGQALSASLATSMGTIECELYPQHAPVTVLNFVELAEGSREWTHPATGKKVTDPLYNGTIFHRVIPGFMIQGGDPLGRGTGGPGYKFEDEVGAGLAFDRPGLLAMANSGPNTNGSQFFITEGSPSHLNGKHTIFGYCEDLDLVKRISGVERDRRDKPATDVTIKTVTIKRG